MQDDPFDKLMFLGGVLGVAELILIFASNYLGISLADGWLAKYDYADSSQSTNSSLTSIKSGCLFR